MKKTLYALVVLCTTSAFGWTCNVPGQIRVQVPTGTVGSGVGDGSGQVVVDNGLTFECETLPTASGTAVNTNTNTATSMSNSNATQGQKQGQSQSSNNNNQSAGGSVSNVGNSVTNVAAPEIPVNSAFAPPVFSSANCFKGWSAGTQTPLLGGSFGGGGIDKNCVTEREAVDYLASGSRLAFCKMKITTKESKAAGVTLEDCMNVPLHVQPTPQPTPVSVQPPIVVTSPAPQIIVIEPPITVVPAAPHKAVVQHKSQRCPVTPLQNECPVVRGEK